MKSQQNLPNASESTSAAATDRARRQRLVLKAAFSASTLLAIVIVLMTNYLSFRHYKRFDLTREGLFTLSDKTKVVLRGLKTDVDIYLFMSRGEPNFADTHELIKRYQATSPRIRVHVVDPDREPAEFQVLAQRFGLGAALLDNLEVGVDVAAVVTAGDKKWSIKRDDLLEWDMNAQDEASSRKVNVKAEQALTGAIVQVISGRPTKLCLTQGHGEWTLKAGADRTLEPLETALRHDNLEWETIDTLGKKTIAKGCDAVFVIGPTRAFDKNEAELLGQYLREGGNLLLALDPIIEQDQIQKSGFEDMVRTFGIAIDPDLVIELDHDHLVSSNPIEFLVTAFGDHPTTRVLQNRARVYLALARSIRPLDGNESEILLRSSAEGFGERDIEQIQNQQEQPKPEATDIKGPVSLAVAKSGIVQSDDSNTKDKQKGRLIVIGDSDWLKGELFSAPDLANFHLASAWTGWLTEREALIAVPPKETKGDSVVFTQAGLSGLFFKIVVLMPGVVMIFGIAVWLNRRS